jgi:hypothetical protein
VGDLSLVDRMRLSVPWTAGESETVLDVSTDAANAAGDYEKRPAFN